MVGFLMGLALKYPAAARFVQRHGRTMAIAGGVALTAGVAIVSFNVWMGHKLDQARLDGKAAAQVEYRAAQDKANATVILDNKTIQLIATEVSKRAIEREADLKVVTVPTIERITREVASNPGSYDCAVSGSVLGEINAARAAADRAAGAGAGR